jgi:hypothetical protein
LIVILGGVLLAGAPPINAHHAFSSEFDANRPVALAGIVSQVEWTNPHAWIHIEASQPDGTVQRWTIEVATPNTLLRRGLRKNDLLAGAKVLVNGYRAKDDSLRAHGTYITLSDRRRIFLSSALADIGDDQR